MQALPKESLFHGVTQKRLDCLPASWREPESQVACQHREVPLWRVEGSARQDRTNDNLLQNLSRLLSEHPQGSRDIHQAGQALQLFYCAFLWTYAREN